MEAPESGVVILLMGATGAGRSHFVNTLTRRMDAYLQNQGSSQGEVTFNITNHNYGTAYNIGHVENATFAHTEPSTPNHRTTKPVPHGPDSSTSTPPHTFVIFALTYLRTEHEAKAVRLGEIGQNSVIVEAWRCMSPEDRKLIEKQAVRSEELHMEIPGGVGEGSEGEGKKERYWNFTGSMVDFWSRKWKEAQAKAKRHAAALGKIFLGMPFGDTPLPSAGGGCGQRTSEGTARREGGYLKSREGHSFPAILV